MPYNASLIAPEAVGSRRQHYSGKEIREMAAEDRQQVPNLIFSPKVYDG
jgi:hypothetical protein